MWEGCNLNASKNTEERRLCCDLRSVCAPVNFFIFHAEKLHARIPLEEAEGNIQQDAFVINDTTPSQTQMC